MITSVFQFPPRQTVSQIDADGDDTRQKLEIPDR